MYKLCITRSDIIKLWKVTFKQWWRTIPPISTK